jgi:hypothetical protein
MTTRTDTGHPHRHRFGPRRPARFPQLQGKRVCLRGPRESDADAVFALFADPT